jgi:hypothetical protein
MYQDTKTTLQTEELVLPDLNKLFDLTYNFDNLKKAIEYLAKKQVNTDLELDGIKANLSLSRGNKNTSAPMNIGDYVSNQTFGQNKYKTDEEIDDLKKMM